MQEIRAQVTGTVWKIHVSVGDIVEAGRELVILESMKMEVPSSAEISGKVDSLKVAEGDSVKPGDLLMVIAS